MQQSVTDIISQEALKQLADATTHLDDCVKKMNELIAVSQKLNFGSGNVTDLQKIAEQEAKIQGLLQQLADAQDKVTKAAEKREAAEKKAADAREKDMNAEYKRQDELNQKAMKIIADREAAEVRRLEREQKALSKLNNEYEQLKKAYTAAANEAKRLGVALGVDSQQFKDASAAAKGMYEQLLKVELAVGQAQRQVGQYSIAAEGLKQTLRELPAFANGVGTGLMAISNNLPTLIDGIKELNKRNKELVAAGGQAVSVWSTLKAELTSFGTVAVVAITALTFISRYWEDLTGYFKEATRNARSARKEFEELASASAKSAAEEMQQVKTLQTIAESTKVSMDIRTRAVRDLQQLYPDYLGNLSKEKILAGDTATEMERLNKALANKAMLEAYNDKVVEQSKKMVDLRDKLKEYKTELERLQAYQQKVNESLAKVQYGKGEGMAQTAVALSNQIKSVNKQIADVDKDIDKTQKRIAEYQKEADSFAQKAAELVVGAAEKPDKAKKEKTPKDDTLKSQSELIKAVYESKVKEQEIIRDRNKAIADDEKADLQDRLKAYNEYFAAVLKLAQLERDMQVELENEKMDDLERQMSKATGKQLENLQDQYKAAQVRINTIQTEYNRKKEVAEMATHKDILGIVNSSNEEWIKSEDYRNQQLKENEIQRYMVEQNLLKHALENKEITRREYNKKLADLQRREQLAMLKNAIEFDEKILKNESLSAEKRLEFVRKLNADKQEYLMAEKGESTGRKTGRITDSVAMLFAPDDLENQEQYLQEFYNRTVDLARQATQAILAARSQQFDEEKKRLDEQASSIRANYELEIAAINATERNEVERQNRINQAMVQTQQKEAEIANQKKKVEIEQAKFQRAASIASIIQSTAVAIASALKYGAAAPPIIALIAAAGAAQLATVANSPIPQYKHGIGIGNGEHKGGQFIAGDGGEPELIMPVGKKPYWSNSSSTLYNEGAGVKVIPMSVIKDAERQLTANSVDYGSVSTTIIKFDENAIIDGLSKRFERSLVAHGNNLAMHIAGSRVDLSGIGEELRKQNALQ